MKSTTILAALLLLVACGSDVELEIASLRAELARQQTEINQLSAFVNAQAEVLRICESAFVELGDYLVNTNAIGMLREAGSQFDGLAVCSDAIARFHTVVVQQGGAVQSGAEELSSLGGEE